VFYEYKCLNCGNKLLINKLIKNAGVMEVCPTCGETLCRVFSSIEIHMNRMVADGVVRTNEPPDDMKPNTYHWDNDKHMTSYPGKAVKRGRKEMKN